MEGSPAADFIAGASEGDNSEVVKDRRPLLTLAEDCQSFSYYVDYESCRSYKLLNFWSLVEDRRPLSERVIPLSDEEDGDSSAGMEKKSVTLG